jgi:hypothetical protein
MKLKRHGGGMRRCKRLLLENKECFKHMHRDRSVDNIEQYKVAKKTSKQAVSEARSQMYDGLYLRLGTMEGEKDIYMMAKRRERKTRDIICDRTTSGRGSSPGST